MDWIKIVIEYAFYLSALGLVIYYRFLFSKILHYSPKKNSTSPGISVVICAKNELSNLQRFLPLLLNQSYPTFEIIVVDDQSNDGTMDFLQELSIIEKKIKPFLFTKNKKSRGKKDPLAYGIEQAKYEHLLLTDADCYPSSKYWIREMASGFTKGKEIVLGVGLYQKEKNLVAQFMRWDSLLVAIQYMSFAIAKKPYMSVGRNVAYTKSLYLKNNGFDAHAHISSGDDDLFIQAAATKTNTAIVFNQQGHTISPAEKTWKALIRQKSRHHTTATKYDKNTLLLLGLFQYLIWLFYTSFICGMIFIVEPYSLLTIFFLKNLVQASIFNRIFVKIGVREQLLPFLLFDGVWVLFLSFINLKNLFRKNTQW